MADWKLEVISTGHVAESGVNQVEWAVYNPDGNEFHRGLLQYPPGAPQADVEESLRLILRANKDAYVDPEKTIKPGVTIGEKKKRKLMPSLRRKNKEAEA